jgi:hypothetical protein
VSATCNESVAAARVLTLFGGSGDWVLCGGLGSRGQGRIKGIFSFLFIYPNQLPNKIQKYKKVRFKWFSK